jgi:hypothetical protein
MPRAPSSPPGLLYSNSTDDPDRITRLIRWNPRIAGSGSLSCREQTTGGSSAGLEADLLVCRRVRIDGGNGRAVRAWKALLARCGSFQPGRGQWQVGASGQVPARPGCMLTIRDEVRTCRRPVPPGFGVGVLLARVVGARVQTTGRPWTEAGDHAPQRLSGSSRSGMRCHRAASPASCVRATRVSRSRGPSRPPGTRSPGRHDPAGTGDAADRGKCGGHGAPWTSALVFSAGAGHPRAGISSQTFGPAVKLTAEHVGPVSPAMIMGPFVGDFLP